MIIGAGVTGLTNARTLRALGVDVTVLEARSDVGGVWSTTRGYPGLRTQNDKRSYALSDLSMPKHFPQHPTSRQVQQYLQAYVDHHDLSPAIRFNTTVTAARWEADRREWIIDASGPEGPEAFVADWLVIANGICSTPNEPSLPGAEEFVAAGGRIIEAASLGDGAQLTGGRVAVLGWGKSAADIAVGALDRAASVTLIARAVGWKLPYRIGRVPFQRLVITRLGEHLLWSPHRTLAGRVLRRLDVGIRKRFVAALERRVRDQLQLARRELDPGTSIEYFTHLVTAGFFEAIDEGRLQLRTGQGIDALLAADEGPAVRLTDGSVVPTDVLVTATGYDQDLGFLDDRTRQGLLNERGELQLYRHTMPERVPNLVFAGWMNSFRSPISGEIQAIWTAALMHGLVQLPAAAGRWRYSQTFQLTHAQAARNGRPQFSAGVSLLDQDAWIQEAGLRVPKRVRAKELLQPIDPGDYAGLHEQLRQRVATLPRSSSQPVSERSSANATTA